MGKVARLREAQEKQYVTFDFAGPDVSASKNERDRLGPFWKVHVTRETIRNLVFTRYAVSLNAGGVIGGMDQSARRYFAAWTEDIDETEEYPDHGSSIIEITMARFNWLLGLLKSDDKIPPGIAQPCVALREYMERILEGLNKTDSDEP